MSVLNSFLNRIQKTLIVLVFIPAAIKTAAFIHNLIHTINNLRDALKEAEHQIRRLQNTVEDLRYQVEDNQRVIQNQMTATEDMQQQLVDHSIDAVSATKDIGDIYECLDLLDDRLLDLVKSEKTRKIKKHVKKDRREAERREIEALDHKSPNEAVFDDFIAKKYSDVFSQEGKASSAELRKLFKEWYDTKYVNPNVDRPSNRKLEEYMCRNFHWSKDAWMETQDA